MKGKWELGLRVRVREKGLGSHRCVFPSILAWIVRVRFGVRVRIRVRIRVRVRVRVRVSVRVRVRVMLSCHTRFGKQPWKPSPFP